MSGVTKYTSILTNLVGFTCFNQSDRVLWCSNISMPISGNSNFNTNASNTSKLKTGINMHAQLPAVPWRYSTLASVYLCQSTKWPQNATAHKLQPIIHYIGSKCLPTISLQAYKLQLSVWPLLKDLSMHVAAWSWYTRYSLMSLLYRLRYYIPFLPATMRIQEAMGYKLVVSPVLGKYPIYSPSHSGT